HRASASTAVTVAVLGLAVLLALVMSLTLVLLLAAALLLLALRALGPGVRRAGDPGRRFEGGRRPGGALAPFAFASGGGQGVLGGEATVHPGVVDVRELVGVLPDQLVSGEEEDVFALLVCIEKIGGFVGAAGGDQVDAAFVQGRPAGAALAAGAAVGGLPLVSVEAGEGLVTSDLWTTGLAIGIGRDEGFAGLEEGALAVGGEEAGHRGEDRSR